MQKNKEEQDKLMQLNKKSEAEHARQLATMRHAESVAILIKAHDDDFAERELKMKKEDERMLAMEREKNTCDGR